MSCWYLIILLCLCGGRCNGGSSFLGCGGGCSAQRGSQSDVQRNGQRNNKREHNCGCENERTQRYGDFGYDGGMMHTHDFSGFANNVTCGCEEKQENDCGCDEGKI